MNHTWKRAGKRRRAKEKKRRARFGRSGQRMLRLMIELEAMQDPRGIAYVKLHPALAEINALWKQIEQFSREESRT